MLRAAPLTPGTTPLTTAELFLALASRLECHGLASLATLSRAGGA